MKNLLRSVIIIFFMLLALGLSGYLGYKSYKAYKTDQILQKSDVYVAFLERIDITILSLEREQLLSALYIGFNGRTDFHQLELVRTKNDTLIKDLERFLKKNPNISEVNISSNEILNNLQYVRSRVDVVNMGYKDILFKYYQDEIIKPLLVTSSMLTQQLGSGISLYKQSLKAYNDLQMYRNDLSLEDGFVAFLLSRSQKIPMHDLVLWEKILSHQKNSSSHISELSKIEPKLLELRVAVLKGVNHANYAISVTSWLAKMDMLINEVISMQQEIYKKLQKIDYKKVATGNFILKLVLSFVSFLVFVWLLFLLRFTKKLPNPKSDNPNIRIKHVEDKTIKPEVNMIKNVNFSDIEKTEKILETQLLKEEAPIQLKTPETRYPNDLPLSNMQPPVVVNTEVKEITTLDSTIAPPSKKVLRREDKTFYTFEEFKSLIKTFMIDADIKNIDFHYDIDPTIPEICIGDIDKIKQFLTLLMNYAMDVTPSKGLVVLEIENIAQKKFESAINFTIKDSGRFIDADERRKIRRGVASHHMLLPDIVTHDKDKSDLSKASRLISLLDGRLEITSEQHKGSSFSVTLNLKKFIVTD